MKTGLRWIWLVVVMAVVATAAWFYHSGRTVHPDVSDPADPDSPAPDATIAAPAPPPAPAGELTIIDGGASPYIIVWAEDAERSKITEAADLLQSLLAQATGVTLPVYDESEAPTGVPAIYLGRTRAARHAGIPVEDITGWSYRMRAVGADLFLVGEERPGREGHGGFSGYAGTYKAVTAFLEQHAGVRFLLPGELGIHVPQTDRLAVPADLDHAWSPLFQFVIGRRISHGAAGREYDPYAIANNYFGRYASDTEIFYSYGTHSYHYVVPAEKYFETNPEYFALLRGQRNPTRHNHLCISNPDVHALLLADMERLFDEGYQMVMLGQSDGYQECECDRCQAIHPDMGEKIWIVHRQLAEEMHRRRPGRQVVMNSYVSTTKPPMSFDRFPTNVVINNNRYIPEYFREWQRFPTPRTVYAPEWSGRLRRVPPRYAVDLIRLFLENDVIGIYLGGGLDCSSGSPWGLNGPAYYAFGKAMEDPTRDADELEREYVEASFGEAAAPMLRFFRTMHRRLEVRALFNRWETGVPDRRFRGYPFEMKPGDYLCHFFAPQILNDMRDALGEALALARDEAVIARIQLVAAEFRYLHSVAAVHHTHRMFRLMPNPETLRLLETVVEQHRQTLAWLQPGGEPRYPGGRRRLRTPYNTGWPVNRRIEMPDSAPFNWDFAGLRERGELPDTNVNVRIRGGQRLPPYPGSHPMPQDLRGPVESEDEYGFHDPSLQAVPFDE